MWTIFWLIWFVLSAFVLSVYGWSLKILFDQKAAWKAFAEKHKLTYHADKLTSSPYITGRYKNYRLYAYTGVQTTNDVSGQRFVTIIEIELGHGVPVAGAVGTKNLGTFILNLNFDHEFVPNSPYWDTSYTLKTRNAYAMKAYLTEERLKALCGLFKMNNASVLYFFDDVESVLRIETPDPLRDSGRMGKILDRVYKVLDILIVDEKEAAQLAREMKREPVDDAPDEKEDGDEKEKKAGDDKKAEKKAEKKPDTTEDVADTASSSSAEKAVNPDST